jgi:thiaminase
LLEFFNYFENHLEPLWIKASQGCSFDDTSYFADALIGFSKSHKQENLFQCAQRLKQSAESFDIENMELTIKKFKTFLDYVQGKKNES